MSDPSARAPRRDTATAGERGRLFVALELPAGVRDAIVTWRESVVGALDGLRAVPAEALHVTLCFLGSQRLDDVDAIAAALATVVRDGQPPADLTLGDPVWLPARRPRTVGIAISDPSGELARLQAGLADALRAGGFYEPEARPFFAHLTVARAGRGARPRRTPIPAPAAIGLSATRVVLYRSRLDRGGARYQVLASPGVP